MAVAIGIKGNRGVAEWTTPFKGITRNKAPHQIDPDALYDAQNVVWYEGSLQPRPGLVQVAPTDLGARITGMIDVPTLATGAFQADTFQNDSFQTAANTIAAVILAATNKKIWVANAAGVFVDITGAALTATDTQLARWTSLTVGGVLYALMTNGVDPPQKWNFGAATATAVAGAPPTFSDWCTAGGRVVGIVTPQTVQWGPAYSISSWPAGNSQVFSDVNDSCVTVRPIQNINVLLYKQRSIWAGVAQGGLDSTFFGFFLRSTREGPANPACLVDADGTHYYMTNTGRIAMFDGANHTWVSEGAHPAIRAVLDTANMARAFGAFDPIRRWVWFFFPRLAEAGNGDVQGLILVVLPRPWSYEGFTMHATFLGSMGVPVSAATDRRLSVNDMILAHATTASGSPNDIYANSGALGTSTDAGTAITGSWTTGFAVAPQKDLIRVIGEETLAARGAAYGTLTATVLTNEMMDSLTAASANLSIDLSIIPRHPLLPLPGGAAPFGRVEGRFLARKYSFTTPVTLQYYGSRLSGQVLE